VYPLNLRKTLAFVLPRQTAVPRSRSCWRPCSGLKAAGHRPCRASGFQHAQLADHVRTTGLMSPKPTGLMVQPPPYPPSQPLLDPQA